MLKIIIIISLTLLFMLYLNFESQAFTYEVGESILVPWGTGESQVYSNAIEFYGNDDLVESGCLPAYPRVWDCMFPYVYILAFDNPAIWDRVIIQVNMTTGAVTKHPIWDNFNDPSHLHLIDNNLEFMVLDDRITYNFYDDQFNLLWVLTLDLWDPILETKLWPISELYELENGLWGILVGHYDQELALWYTELRKYNVNGVLVETIPQSPTVPYVYVFDILPDGSVSMNNYVDQYGGVFLWVNGELIRREEGQEYTFTWTDHPAFWVDYPSHRLYPQFDGSVYSFEYTNSGILLRKFEYVP